MRLAGLFISYSLCRLEIFEELCWGSSTGHLYACTCVPEANVPGPISEPNPPLPDQVFRHVRFVSPCQNAQTSASCPKAVWREIRKLKARDLDIFSELSNILSPLALSYYWLRVSSRSVGLARGLDPGHFQITVRWSSLSFHVGSFRHKLPLNSLSWMRWQRWKLVFASLSVGLRRRMGVLLHVVQRIISTEAITSRACRGGLDIGRCNLRRNNNRNYAPPRLENLREYSNVRVLFISYPNSLVKMYNIMDKSWTSYPKN